MVRLMKDEVKAEARRMSVGAPWFEPRQRGRAANIWPPHAQQFEMELLRILRRPPICAATIVGSTAATAQRAVKRKITAWGAFQ
jgi:hypothetical protein